MTTYGWFSEKQAKTAGSSIYLQNGKEVEVSEITSTPVCTSHWDDRVALGLVDKFVRTAQVGWIDTLFPEPDYPEYEEDPRFDR